MMIRVLFFLLVSASFMLRASEPISVPYSGASATVKQPHVTAELIPELSKITQGQSFDVILHLHSATGWHTYWINPGDAGLATSITWTLPEGFTAGPIQWPTPEKHKMGPLVTYGYEGDVYLLTAIAIPKGFSGKFQIRAKASWLVCKEECIPGKGEFELNLECPVMVTGIVELNTRLFDEARMRLPVPNKGWDVTGWYVTDNGKPSLKVSLTNKFGHAEKDLGTLQFFPEQSNVLDPQANLMMFPQKSQNEFVFETPLIANGDKPDKSSGVLVSDVSLVSEKTGDSHAVYISEFPVTSEVAAAVPGGGSDSSANSGDGHRPPLQAAATSEGQPWLLAVLGAAFVGGLILNLMPCVLPVLSLKVFSLMKHAEEDHSKAWKQGVAFTAGVVLSFWLLAGVLLVLRAAGNHLGWGFQMQSPGFVLALIFIFFLLGLNLFGVFELGTSLVGLDAKVTGKAHGLTSSFLNGALATLAATPCTAPFMGSALGFAAQQSAFISMLIFTFLAFGMAAPYLLLTIFPHALRYVPKPGAWMEAFKQFMGFLLILTVVWLVSVYGSLKGNEAMIWLLAALWGGALSVWIYGRWGFSRMIVAVLILGGAGYFLYPKPSQGWQPCSTAAVQQALAKGKPVFVDFTADWCLSCKVNERVALDTDAVRKAFRDKGVVLFKADWTHSDPEISKALQQYNRDGVPLYLLYSPKEPSQPQVLPEVLTPGIVLDALERL